MAVQRGMRPCEDAFGSQPWVQFADTAGADDFHLEAHIGSKALNVAEPVHLFGGGGQTDAAAAVPAGRMAGQRLQSGVKTVAVMVDLGHVVIADERRALPGGMPGRAAGQLALLDQQHIRPAFFGKVIGQTHPHHAAADDHHLGLCLHASLPYQNPLPACIRSRGRMMLYLARIAASTSAPMWRG